MPRATHPKLDRPWKIERQKLRDYFKSAPDNLPQPLDTARRVQRKRRKARAVERVLRWRQRHPKTYARQMRAYRKRRKAKAAQIAPLKTETARQPASTQAPQPTR